MGGCFSSIGGPSTGNDDENDDDLPLATEDELDALRSRGHLPVVAGPSVDFRGNNQLSTLYVAEYENGAELTLLFLDEDRPNMCEDWLYDAIRRPLFGRKADIETVLIVGNEMIFPGTYCADQTWGEKMPKHNETTVAMDRFERRHRRDDGSKDKNNNGDDKNNHPPFVLWINTWNHLVGEKNNNTTMEITYQEAAAAASQPSSSSAPPPSGTEDNNNNNKLGHSSSSRYVVRRGSRAEVDGRFHGWMTSVSTVMTPERSDALGRRLF
jgi:hypothetical protein